MLLRLLSHSFLAPLCATCSRTLEQAGCLLTKALELRWFSIVCIFSHSKNCIYYFPFLLQWWKLQLRYNPILHVVCPIDFLATKKVCALWLFGILKGLQAWHALCEETLGVWRLKWNENLDDVPDSHGKWSWPGVTIVVSSLIRNWVWRNMLCEAERM